MGEVLGCLQNGTPPRTAADKAAKVPTYTHKSCTQGYTLTHSLNHSLDTQMHAHRPHALTHVYAQTQERTHAHTHRHTQTNTIKQPQSATLAQLHAIAQCASFMVSQTEMLM